MLKYILGRILYFIPTLIIISLIGFWISSIAPGDPSERLSAICDSRIESKTISKEFWRKKLGLDLPLFYFSIRSLDEPDTLNRIADKAIRSTLYSLYSRQGNWTAVSEYYQSLITLNKTLEVNITSSNSGSDLTSNMTAISENLLYQWNSDYINTQIQSLEHLAGSSLFSDEVSNLKTAFLQMQKKEGSWKIYIPRLTFNSNNQYHRWIFGDGVWYNGKNHQETAGIIRGDFGLSFTTREPVHKIIGSRIVWSVILALLSVVFAYLISIPLGAYAAANHRGWFDRISSIVLFGLFSLPSFWLATLLLMTFANPDQVSLFPASGIKAIGVDLEELNIFQKISAVTPYLILPLICYTYSSIAFLSRTCRGTMLDNLKSDYVRTATAKGMKRSAVVYKHALKNSLLPLVTTLGNVFPLAIGGSVIIETIFSIPGMGAETVRAVYDQNFPMLIAVFTISGLLTVIGYLVSDILYALFDPRIRLGK